MYEIKLIFINRTPISFSSPKLASFLDFCKFFRFYVGLVIF